MFNQFNLPKHTKYNINVENVNTINENENIYNYGVLENIYRIIQRKNSEFKGNGDTAITQKIKFFNEEIFRHIEATQKIKDKNMEMLIDFYQYALNNQTYENNKILKLIITRFLYAIEELLSRKETYNTTATLLKFIGREDKLCYAFFNMKNKTKFYKKLYDIIVFDIDAKILNQLNSIYNKSENITPENKLKNNNNIKNIFIPKNKSDLEQLELYIKQNINNILKTSKDSDIDSFYVYLELCSNLFENFGNYEEIKKLQNIADLQNLLSIHENTSKENVKSKIIDDMKNLYIYLCILINDGLDVLKNILLDVLNNQKPKNLQDLEAKLNNNIHLLEKDHGYNNSKVIKPSELIIILKKFATIIKNKNFKTPTNNNFARNQNFDNLNKINPPSTNQTKYLEQLELYIKQNINNILKTSKDSDIDSFYVYLKLYNYLLNKNKDKPSVKEIQNMFNINEYLTLYKKEKNLIKKCRLQESMKTLYICLCIIAHHDEYKNFANIIYEFLISSNKISVQFIDCELTSLINKYTQFEEFDPTHNVDGIKVSYFLSRLKEAATIEKNGTELCFSIIKELYGGEIKNNNKIEFFIDKFKRLIDDYMNRQYRKITKENANILVDEDRKEFINIIKNYKDKTPYNVLKILESLRELIRPYIRIYDKGASSKEEAIKINNVKKESLKGILSKALPIIYGSFFIALNSKFSEFNEKILIFLQDNIKNNCNNIDKNLEIFLNDLINNNKKGAYYSQIFTDVMNCINEYINDNMKNS